MSSHPGLVQAMAADRAAELSRTARTHPDDRVLCRRPRLTGNVRFTAGWFLVDLGLRLAIPQHGPRRSIARGAR